MSEGKISIEKAILLDVCFGIPLGRVAFSTPLNFDMPLDAIAPDTFLFRGEQLALMKAMREAGNSDVAEAVEHLISVANEAVSQDLVGPTDKPASRFSDDPRDYQSLAKYWWPDPNSESGLPYRNRDGEINPDCYSDDFDAGRLTTFSETVVLLALAGYLTGERAYCDRAAQWLTRWLTDAATRLNPNFQYAQKVPGRETIRWQGIIEARHLIYVAEAVQLLSSTGLLTMATTKGVKGWFGELLDWMTQSEEGKRAKEADNNIGFWYDLQCMVYAHFCGRHDMAQQIAFETLLPRVNEQIAIDGALPNELSRAYPHDYVAFTVAALAMLSRLGERHDLRLWDQQEGDGRSFQVAHDWLVRAQRELFTRLGASHGEVDDAKDPGLLLDIGIRLRAVDRAAALVRHSAESARGALREVLELNDASSKQVYEMQRRLTLAEDKLQKVESKAAKLQARNKELEGELADQVSASGKASTAAVDHFVQERDAFVAYADKLERRIRLILASNSWRLTRPVRAIVRWITRKLTGQASPPTRLPVRPKLSSMTDRKVGKDKASEANAAKTATRPTQTGSRTPEAAALAAVEPRKPLLATKVAAVVERAKQEVVSRAGGNLADDALDVLLRHQPKDEDRLKQEYLAKGLDKVPDTFVLYRIIGNDLVPRHKKGQSRENVRFLLENEPALANCEKRWIVNRIIDPDEEQQIIAMLDEHGQSYLRIPFDADEYRKIGWDYDALPSPDYLSSEAFLKLEPVQQDRARTALYRLKNLYVMNNNGARNAALEQGRELAKWVLPWDGNCFVTAKGWEEITSAVTARPHLKYFVVPMERITNNDDLLRQDFVPRPIEEPQLLFRSDAEEQFNPAFPYGRRPKVELFWRLGIPGAWNRWKDDPWEQKRRDPSPEAGQFGVAGWVARMFSGAKHLEQEDKVSFKNRGLARQEAIVAAIDHVDRTLTGTSGLGASLTYYNENALESAKAALAESAESGLGRLAARILTDAEDALKAAPVSVVGKTTLPPSGDIHDYWHPAPYWWPDPSKPDGLPYIQRDGQRVPGTVMYEPESAKYDRTRLQLMFDRSVSLALAWRMTGRQDFAEHGAAYVRTWFLNPESRMNPHLRYSQVRMGRNGNEGNATGIIELKDFYYFLDAVRLLERSGALKVEEVAEFKSWLRTYLGWLETSKQGRKEMSAENNHGTYFDLQVAAIQSYLGDTQAFGTTLARAKKRIAQQFTPDGQQPQEMTRSITQHYCFFNLQGWLNLALIAQANGMPFGPWTEPPQERIATAVHWVLGHDMTNWPYEQIEPFDVDRANALALVARRLSIAVADRRSEADHLASEPVFNPHDAIAPYWNMNSISSIALKLSSSTESMAIQSPAAATVVPTEVDEHRNPVSFLIPLMPKLHAKDWIRVEENLERTVQSILRSSSGYYQILISYHDRPEGTYWGETQVIPLEVPFDPVTDIMKVSSDKHRKRAYAAAYLKRAGWRSGHIMFLDADDLVSCDLVNFLMEDKQGQCWQVHSGYRVDEIGGQVASVEKNFFRSCGSSFVAFLNGDELPDAFGDTSSPFSSINRAGHKEMADRATALGKSVAPVPFPAVAYITNHPESLNQKQTGKEYRPLKAEYIVDSDEESRHLSRSFGLAVSSKIIQRR